VVDDVRRSATAALLTADRKRLSLVDCVNFEVMRRRVSRAFTFDPDFTARVSARLTISPAAEELPPPAAQCRVAAAFGFGFELVERGGQQRYVAALHLLQQQVELLAQDRRVGREQVLERPAAVEAQVELLQIGRQLAPLLRRRLVDAMG
jgi:hypothetical protein